MGGSVAGFGYVDSGTTRIDVIVTSSKLGDTADMRCASECRAPPSASACESESHASSLRARDWRHSSSAITPSSSTTSVARPYSAGS